MKFGDHIFARVCRLLAACLFAASLAIFSSPADAQIAPPPVPFNADKNGVNVTTGTLVGESVDVSIGPSDSHGLRFARQLVNSGWRMSDVPTMNGSTSNPVVSFGGRSIPFQTVGGVYVPNFPDGSTLSNDRTTFTSGDGTVVTFGNAGYGLVGYQDTSLGMGTNITYPDGTTWTFNYITVAFPDYQYWCDPTYGCQYWGQTDYLARLNSITSSTGYQIKLAYATDGLSHDTLITWGQITTATAINNSVEYCDPGPGACSFANTWPAVTFTNTPSIVGAFTGATDPAGRQTTYTYDVNTGNMTAMRAPGASSDTVTYGYDVNTGKVSSVSKGGGTWSYAYPSTTQTTITDPNSNVVTLNYDTSGEITSQVAGGQTTTFTYSSGELYGVTSPEQNYTVYTYDARGNQTSATTNPKPSVGGTAIVTSATFPSSCTNAKTCNKPTSTTDARGHVTDYTYDSATGQVTSVKSPADASGVRPETRIAYGTVYAWAKNSSGTLVQSTPMMLPTSVSGCRTGSAPSCVGTADEKLKTLAYPTSGPSNALPSSVTVKSGDNTLVETTAMTYDNYGNVVSVDGPLSGTADTSVAFYNLARQQTGLITPDPDGAGSLPNLAKRITYSSAGLPYLVEQGTTAGQTASALSTMTVTGSQVTAFDDLGRTLTVTAKGSDGVAYALTQTGYDTAGRVNCVTVRMNPAIYGSLPTSCTLGTAGSYGPDQITLYTYDAVNRTTQVTSGYGTTAAANDQTITYSNNGVVATAKDAESNLTTYEYDGFDRLIKTRFPVGTKGANSSSTTDYEQYGLDANGNLTTFRTRRNETLTLTYDNLNRLITKIVPERTGLSSTYTRDVYYGYDLFGDPTFARFDSTSGEGISFTYDALGRQLTETQAMDGTSRAITSSYDADNSRLFMAYPDGNYVNYIRDSLERLYYSELNASSPLFYPPYDSAGRASALYRWSTTAGTWGPATGFSYDPLSRLSGWWHDLAGSTYDSTTTISYNPASQITSQARTNDTYAWHGASPISRGYSANGLNQYSAVAGSTFSYDADGNLISDGTSSYVYDVENRMVSATVSGASATLRYDPLGRLYEVNGSATGITRFLNDGDHLVGEYNSSGTLLRRYVHGESAGDDPQVWFEGSGVADTARRYLYSDERGSIVAITDSAGNETALNSYDEYGIPDDAGSLTTKGRFRYTGQAWIPELGMSYYKARMYSPTLGRFMQTDPIGYGDGMNMYRYVRNDPLNLVDPTGLDWVWNCVTIGGGNPDPSGGNGTGGGEYSTCGWGWDGQTSASYYFSLATGGYGLPSSPSSSTGGSSPSPNPNPKPNPKSNPCTAARRAAGDLAKGFEGLSEAFGAGDLAAGLGTIVSAAGEVPSAGADTGITVALGGATVTLGELALASGGMAASLKSFANGGDPGALESFGFSHWTGSRAAKFAGAIPGLGRFAKLFEFSAEKAAALATEVKTECGDF